MLRKSQGDAKKIDVFQNHCLEKIMKVKWQDKASNRELLERANMERLRDDVRGQDGDSLDTSSDKNPTMTVLQP